MGKVIMSGIVEPLVAPVSYKKVLNDNTWELISQASQQGIASSLWSVGDTKTITINGTVGATTFSNLSIDVFIIGFNHNESVEGSNHIHFQIGKINNKYVALCDSNYDSYTTTSGYFTMNLSQSNSGGWSSSVMRKTILDSDGDPLNPASGSLLATLPSDLRTVMKSITKRTDNTGGSNTASYVTATTDCLWLLSEFEVCGTRTGANVAEQNYQGQYEYYATGNSKKKYKHSATGTSVWWRLRSPRSADTGTFVTIGTDGSSVGMSAHYSGGIAPAFAV